MLRSIIRHWRSHGASLSPSSSGAVRTLSPAASSSTSSREAALDTFRRARTVCFDVDSTVITVEAIDEFAAFAGKKEAVAALTAKAMGDLLTRFLAVHPFVFTPGLESLVGALKARGTRVYLVSGGFTQMIYPVADALGVPRDRVFANTILFQRDGSYEGFDRSAPTSSDGGKARVVASLKEGLGPAASPLVMVGDGVTDMQARPPADAFIGYGGVVVREPVRVGADLFVRDWAELLAGLPTTLPPL